MKRILAIALLAIPSAFAQAQAQNHPLDRFMDGFYRARENAARQKEAEAARVQAEAYAERQRHLSQPPATLFAPPICVTVRLNFFDPRTGEYLKSDTFGPTCAPIASVQQCLDQSPGVAAELLRMNYGTYPVEFVRYDVSCRPEPVL